MMKKIVAPLLALSLASLAHGQTLEAIKNTKEIRLGYVKGGFPFMYVDEGQENPNGFSHDIALMIVKKIQAHLNVPELKVSYSVSAGDDRFKMLNSGELHLYCVHTTNLKDFSDKANMSTNYFYVESRFIVKKDSGIKTYGDIAGKTVASSKGTIADKFIASRKGNLKYKALQHTKNYMESIPLLIKGEVDAVLTDDYLGLGNAVYQATDFENYELIGGPLQKKHYTCLLPKGDSAYKEVVDKAIQESFKNGEWQKIYDKWFTKSIPPKNINFNAPVSDNQLKFIVMNPSDAPASN